MGLFSDVNFIRISSFSFPFQDNIPDSSLRKLKKYIDNPNFLPEIAEKSSKVNKKKKKQQRNNNNNKTT